MASVEQGTRNSRSAASFNGQPAILLTIVKSADANVIETVDRILELIPEIKRWIPAGIDISILSDRTTHAARQHASTCSSRSGCRSCW